MGKLSRTKGHAWERRVARDLTYASGKQYKRNLTEAREGNSGDVLAVSSTGDDMPIAAIHRTGRGGEKLAVMRWEDFMELASAVPGYTFVVQAKCGARPDIYGAVREAVEGR